MSIAGIIGGIAPASTVDYYRSIIARYREQRPDGSYPRIIINSIDMKRMLDLIGSGELAKAAVYLLDEIERLHKAGADFGIMASNTPHVVFDELRQRSPLPLVSIVEVTCRAATTRGLKRPALFGTRFTMQGRFYSEALLNAGIETVLPSPDEQDYIHDKYMGELVNAVFLPETREGLLSIVERLRRDEGIDGLILGGTELPLIMQTAEYQGLPFLDTTRLHVEATVSRLL